MGNCLPHLKQWNNDPLANETAVIRIKCVPPIVIMKQWEISEETHRLLGTDQQKM